MILLDPATGEPVSLLDGTALTALRTGAASGLATALLSRPGARTAAVLGAGGQARHQILGITAVRDLAEIRVWSPTRERVETLVSKLQPEVDARLVTAASAETAVRETDIVCTATTATRPIVERSWLAPGTHLNAIGSFTPAMRELDGPTVAEARIVVDSREAASREAGELIAALELGSTRASDWIELGELVAAPETGETDAGRAEDGLTVFKSVGLAVQDLFAGERALSVALERGLGRSVTL